MLRLGPGVPCLVRTRGEVGQGAGETTRWRKRVQSAFRSLLGFLRIASDLKPPGLRPRALMVQTVTERFWAWMMTLEAGVPCSVRTRGEIGQGA